MIFVHFFLLYTFFYSCLLFSSHHLLYLLFFSFYLFLLWYKYPNEVLSHHFHTSIIFLSLHYYSVSIEICGSTPFSQNLKGRYIYTFLYIIFNVRLLGLVCLGLRVYVLGSITCSCMHHHPPLRGCHVLVFCIQWCHDAFIALCKLLMVKKVNQAQ